MAQENVEIERGFYEAFGRGDLESALAAFDQEIVAYDHDIPDPVSTGGWKDCFVGRPTGRTVGKAGIGSPRSSSRLVIVLSRSSGSKPKGICGRPATDIDHIIPIGAGGDDSMANLRP